MATKAELKDNATVVAIDNEAKMVNSPRASHGFGFSMSCANDARTDRVDFIPEAIVLENGMTYHLKKPTKYANPGPIGLMAFGITTVLLNVLNAGLIDKSAIVIIVAYGALHGGLVQVLAGMWEIKRGNLFGAVAFSSYGAFWLGFAMFEILIATKTYEATDIQGGLCAWLCVWGVFTLIMLLNTWRLNRALQLVFLTLTFLFFLLAGGEYNATCKKIAGWVGILCGLLAMYVGGAELTNEMFDQTVMPLFPMKRH